MANTGLEVRETGRVLRVQTETPHLVSTGSGRLSVAVTLHPLPEGRVTLGSGREADISVSGTGVESIHCTIENENNIVTLYPISGRTAIDGVAVNSPVRLAQGCMLSFGRSSYMRFNHPAEAKQLKSVLPNSRISMAPISFSLGENFADNNHLERKPPVAPRKSPRNSYSEDEGFLGKLTKFEMLARQGNRGVCVSPKVFPAGSGTANVPADQILGYSRSSSLASLTKNNNNSPLQNLTNFDRSRSNTPTTVIQQIHDDSRLLQRGSREINKSNTNVNGISGTSPSTNQNGHIQVYANPSHRQIYIENNNENDDNRHNRTLNSTSAVSQSLVCQRSSEYDNFGREYDMSQSLIVAKTTTEYFQVEQFGSNPNIRDHEPGGGGQAMNGNPFGSNPNVRRIHPPSPAFNRNPKYSDLNQQRRVYGSPSSYAAVNNYGNRVKSPTPSIGSNCSIEELRERQIDAENKRKEAEIRRKQAQEERLREQEVERQEKMRLEEILAMCAEYEKQSTVDHRQPRQPNRIKTNGSLPREKRPGYNSPFDSPRSPSSAGSQQSQFSFCESPREIQAVQNTVPYENVNIQVQGGQRNGRVEIIGSENHHGNESRYENIRIIGENDGESNSTLYGKIQQQNSTPSARFNSGSLPRNYENFSPVNGNSNSSNIEEEEVGIDFARNNNNSHLNVVADSRNVRNNNNNQQQQKQQQQIQQQQVMQVKKNNPSFDSSFEVIENKLAISNDDLLEAIEQLSMISKSKEAFATPKRNNSERDNAKSNESKADKAREELEIEDRKKYVEFLQNEKLHIHSNMDVLKRSIADIETQEEEIGRELELEKALLSAEYEAESLKLSQDEGEKIRIQMRINELEREMAEDTSTQANLQSEAKQRVQNAQQACFKIEEELQGVSNDDKIFQELNEKLLFQQDLLESERKAFEDLEFHHLEEEASKLATREELQRYLTDLSARIETKKAQLNNLESQRNSAKNTAIRDTRSLERQKLGHVRRLEEGRNRLRAIDDELENLARNAAENPDEKRSPSREDFDRISRVTTDSPIVQNNQGSLGKKAIESLKEIERNRQLHLAKQGSQVISDERRRVEELKRRVQDEVRTQWEERKMNCASFNSVESGEESSSYSTGGPTESGSGSSDGADGGASEKLSPGKSSPGPNSVLGNGPSVSGSSNGGYALIHQRGNTREEKRISLEGGRTSSNSGGMPDGSGSRPQSQTSSELDTIGPLQPVKYREKPKLQRPLTRYLPIKSESLDLRNHIETAGHQLQLIHDVSVDTTTCCGYLSKMSKKFHHWNKRWFVFDRKRKTLSYYSDSSAKKARGIIYFQSIEEVYVDHLNSVRSPQPSLTFIVKTSARLYHLMAPSPEAMRVWVDVVFTGAEGYHEFDHGV